ncbi:hypothetical protein [Sphingomonas sp. Leaf4]|uniref:hypothetical protein n=1 Tax=Sphingomonas sp. Leaf4 TaxID=2876553 RepID=UPI001E2E889F|nr:hypothetical protein [Sphingomonas sp. Leaf4]
MTDNAAAPVVALIEWARGQQALPDGTAGGAGWGHIDEKHRFKLRDLIKQIDEKRDFASTPPGSAEEVARAMFEADPDIGMTWAAFVALADREPDYQPLIDGQRRAARAAVHALRHTAPAVEKRASTGPFIVWSPDGAAAPTVQHKSHGSAHRAAHLLAKQHPGRTFIVMEKSGKRICVEPSA